MNVGGAAVLCQPISECLYDKNFRLSLSGVAAVQTLNARLNSDDHSNNELAKKIAEASGLKTVGGSGAEICACIGRAYTVFENHIKSISDLVRELRQGSYFASDSIHSREEEYGIAVLRSVLCGTPIPDDLKEKAERAEYQRETAKTLNEIIVNIQMDLEITSSIEAAESFAIAVNFYKSIRKKYVNLGELYSGLKRAEIDKTQIIELLSLKGLLFPRNLLESIRIGYSDDQICLKIAELKDEQRIKS